jgi:hypothetical protein
MIDSLTGLVRAIILVMVAVPSLVLFLNLAFFFPWYLTMVETGFTVSQTIASNNYLPCEEHDRMMDKLLEYPVFKKRAQDIEIKAWHIDADKDAIEHTDTKKTYLCGKNLHDASCCYYGDPTLGADEDDYKGKPYVQMGHLVQITVTAAYPLQLTLFGKDIHDFDGLNFPDIEVSFVMNTTTTKHYKDLYYPYTDTGTTIDDNFFSDWD